MHYYFVIFTIPEAPNEPCTMLIKATDMWHAQSRARELFGENINIIDTVLEV